MQPLDLVRRLMPRRLKNALKARLGMPMTRLHPDWKILDPIGPVTERHTIIDAGSHHGWFFHCWKDWCPSAVVHAFDADPEAVAKSRELYGSDPDVHVHNAGLGSTHGRLQFHVLEGSRVSSSFLMPEEATWKEIDYHTGPITDRTVDVIPLDAFAREHALGEVYLLKIDVQGFELAVLEGAQELLRRTRYVFVEAAIRPLYQGAPRFTGVHDFLDAHGFHLIAMRAWHRGNLTLVESDLLFRRNDLMPPIDPTVDRIMVQV
jgi:FkbM family methyltransferase